MKRFLYSLIIAALVAVSCFSLFACADGGAAAGKKGLKYNKYTDEDFYTVYAYTDDGVTEDLVIPSEIDGVAVGRISSGAFKNNSSLKSITVPASVTEIGTGAFAGIKNLQSITLPFVGANADSDVFFRESEDKENKAVNEARHFCYIFGTEEYEEGTAITAAYDDTNSATYYVPASLKEVKIKTTAQYGIPMYAFGGYANTLRVTLEGNIDAIGVRAFYNCTNLVSVNVPATVIKIYDGAFENCTNASLNVDMSQAVALVSLGEKAFYKTNIKTVTLPAAITEIGEMCFAQSAIKTVVLSQNLAKINHKAFYACAYLTTVDSSAVTAAEKVKLYNSVFEDCALLDKATVIDTNKFEEVGANVFVGTKNI